MPQFTIIIEASAIHYEWPDAMGKNNNLCLLPMDEIKNTLIRR
ncbi:hypothetical protein [sulfur-oxidizing endosymbiont of Gigantopelta aegis]|nr:hypothetical protein [sulfur-oxidizing endosymbiont of Gigantopelta aegis]